MISVSAMLREEVRCHDTDHKLIGTIREEWITCWGSSKEGGIMSVWKVLMGEAFSLAWRSNLNMRKGSGASCMKIQREWRHRGVTCRAHVENGVVLSCPNMELVKSLLGPALRFQGIEGRVTEIHRRRQDQHPGGQRYVELGQDAVWNIWANSGNQISHLKNPDFWLLLKIWATRGVFFQDGGWRELSNGCFLSVGREFCLPSTESQPVSSFTSPARPLRCLSVRPLLGYTGRNKPRPKTVRCEWRSPKAPLPARWLTHAGCECSLALAATPNTGSSSLQFQHPWLSKLWDREVFTASPKAALGAQDLMLKMAWIKQVKVGGGGCCVCLLVVMQSTLIWELT